MAIYHLHVRTNSRAKGHSAVRKFDYILRQGFYRNQPDKLIASGHFNMPSWAQSNPREFWRATDRHERVNATLLREIEVALPRELDLKENIQLVKKFIQKIAPNHPASIAIHEGNGRNPHAHIIICERKCADLPPDKFFSRSNPKNREMKSKDWLLTIRKEWAKECNRMLDRKGIDEKIDHRSYAERGILKLPQPKIGRIKHMWNRGLKKVKEYDKFKQWKHYIKIMKKIVNINKEIRRLKKQIAVLQQKRREKARAFIQQQFARAEAAQAREAAQQQQQHFPKPPGML